MKKLICAKDIETIIDQGKKVFYVDNNTIITPLAKDTAKNFGVEFSTEIQSSNIEDPCLMAEASGDEIDSHMIYKVLKLMEDKGLLEEILNLFTKKPYIAETSPEGLKVIKGSSVEFKPYNTGNSQDKVFYQELINDEDSKLSSGLLKIDNSNFSKKLKEEVSGYVIEGSLDIEINRESFTINSGDIFYIPSNVEFTIGSSNKTKLFYVKN